MKIALLGAAPSSRLIAPFHDPEWEIWACSPPNYDLPRVDAWFEIHNLDRKFANPSNKPYFDVLAKHQRVYIAKEDERLPNAILYPKDEMVAKYGRYFFTSSLAWMAALAIEMKPEKIGLWGVDMSAAEEYGYQRAGMHFFIREAERAGIKIYAPPQSDILQPIPLYGFKEQWASWQKSKTRRKELEERLNGIRSIMQQKHDEELILRGAIDDMNYQDNTWLHE